MFRKAYWFMFVLMFLVPMGFGTAGVSAQAQQIPVIDNSPPPVPIPQAGDHVLVKTDVNTSAEALSLDVGFWLDRDPTIPTIIIGHTVYIRGVLLRNFEMRAVDPTFLSGSMCLQRWMDEYAPGTNFWVDARRQVMQGENFVALSKEGPFGMKIGYELVHMTWCEYCFMWLAVI